MVYRQWDIPFEELTDQQRAGLDYWNGLRKGDALPLIRDFDLMALPSKTLPTTHVADVIDGGREFKYRFWGSGFRHHFSYDGTGLTTAELRPEEIREPVRQSNQKVLAVRGPVATMSEFRRGVHTNSPGFQKILRLPLADEDGEIQRIVALVHFLQDQRESQRIIAEIERGDET